MAQSPSPFIGPHRFAQFWEPSQISRRQKGVMKQVHSHDQPVLDATVKKKPLRPWFMHPWANRSSDPTIYNS